MPPESSHLFIVRIWREPGRAAASPWRGSVDHVPSGERRFFAELDDLTAFINQSLSAADVIAGLDEGVPTEDL